MPIQTTYAYAKKELAKLWDDVIYNQEIAIVTGRGAENIAIVPASELSGILETNHLLKSSRNAERLLNALQRAKTGKEPIQSVDALKKEVGFE
ncbi:MAG: type II toxin-antitoxin system Phd/YefM family antitoxin [Desulfococcaceae bacterium]